MVQEIMGKLAHNPGLLAKLKATKTPEEIVALAKSEGIDLDVNDVKQALEKGLNATIMEHLGK
ncbi:Nif11-like leader peptide family natural product precursor [Clostridia bacterium OttesenSCG-928-O13]|nr:Nif11-like leader peptide family natural product precursor [Clostridia bacterium OttesenSCG-928-O13]